MILYLTMSRAEIAIALKAVGGYADNEHDKGCNDDCYSSNIIDSVLDTLNKLSEVEGDGPLPVGLHPSCFGLMCDAVATYCTDPADYEDEAASAEAAFAERLAELPSHYL